MAKTTADIKRRSHLAAVGHHMTQEEMEKIILSLESQLYAIRCDVDRLTLKERVDSLACRVACLEAALEA